jgi:hypothetical protein
MDFFIDHIKIFLQKRFYFLPFLFSILFFCALKQG